MIYTTFIILTLFFSYIAEKTEKKRYVFFVALILSLLSGLRSVTVGVDTRNYYSYIENVRYSGSHFGNDAGFSVLCSGLLQVFDSPAYLLLIFAIITNFLIIYRCWDFENKASFFTMIAVYIVLQFPYSLNIVRQYLAIAIIFFASRYIERGKNWIYIILTIFATSIHTSAVMGFVYLIAYKSTVENNKKVNRRYLVTLLAMFIAVILMNQFAINRYFQNYFENTITYSFSLLTIYRLLCVVLIIAISRFFRVNRFSITTKGEIIGLDKSISLICLGGIILCVMGMFLTYMNRIGFYFVAFEMPFWGQVCKTVNKTNRRFFRLMLFAMLLYVYIHLCTTNEVANYMTFFTD